MHLGVSNLTPSQLSGSLVIDASFSMSLFCYSILRLDPYKGCSFHCSYCFTNFLPGKQKSASLPVTGFLRAFDKIVEKLKQSPILMMPFRLSALTEPFPPIEEKTMLSLNLLKLALKRNLKIIISTKSSIIAKEPWIGTIKDLNDRGNIVVQLTLTTIDERISKLLEPGAPLPSERLKTIEKISKENVPVIVRLQPIIPFINDDLDSLEELVQQVSSAGAKQIIAECYRFLSWKDLDRISAYFNSEIRRKINNPELWEKFPYGSHKRPKESYRRSIYESLLRLASRYNLLFSTCREGMYRLHTAPNCCGIHFMKGYKLRPTLREYTLGLADNSTYITRGDLSTIPIKNIREKLIEHFDYLEKYLCNKNH